MGQWGAKGMAENGAAWTDIVTHYYSGITIGSRAPEDLRVLVEESPDTVVFADTPVTARWSNGATITQSSDTYPFLRARYSGGDYILERSASHTGPWSTVATSGSYYIVFTRSNTLLQLVFGSGTVRYYRGSIMARYYDGSMRSINVVDLEDYLYGVVPRESPAYWPAEALKSQSVAARTYAVYKKVAARARGTMFDICASTQCQVYGGYGVKSSPTSSRTNLEYSQTNAAVDATAGKVMLYSGSPILAEYSSSTGGYSAPGSVAYQKAVPDPTDAGSPHHSWTGSMRVSEIEQRWPQIGNLVDVTVTKRNGYGDWGGRVLSMDLAGTSGTVTITGHTFRNAFAWPTRSNGVRGNWFTVLYWRGALVSAPSTLSLGAGEAKTLIVRIRNTGTASWPIGGTIRIATPSASPFATDAWISSTRAASVYRNVTTTSKNRVDAGEVAEFRIPMDASGVQPGSYRQPFSLVADGHSAVSLSFTVTVEVLQPWIDEAPNLLTNPSFEGSLAGWSGTIGSGDGLSTLAMREGATSLRLRGGADKVVSQTIGLAGGTARRFTLGGWNRTSSSSASGGPVELRAIARYSDGYAGTYRVAFPRAAHGWTYDERTFETDAGRSLVSVTVAAVYLDQTGDAWFDALRLIETPFRNMSFEDGMYRWVGTGLTDGDGPTAAEKRDGEHALVLAGAAGVKSVRQSFPLEARRSERFVLGVWSKAVGTTAGAGDVSSQVTLWHPDGTRTDVALELPSEPHEWRYSETVVRAPATVTSATIYARVGAQTGSVYFDALRLIRSWVYNPSFEPTLDPWTLYSSGDDDGPSAELARSGAGALVLSGGGRQSVRQEVPVRGRAGGRFLVAGWVRTEGTTPGTGTIGLTVGFRNEDGTTSWRPIRFSTEPHDWIYSEIVVTAPKPYTRVDLYAIFYDQTGLARFDGVRLHSL